MIYLCRPPGRALTRQLAMRTVFRTGNTGRVTRHLRRSFLILACAMCSCGTVGGKGDRTVLVPDQSTSSITVRLLFHAGSAYDPPDRDGLAYLTAAAITRGAAATSSPGRITATVDREVVAIDGTCAPDHWPDFVRALTSLLAPRTPDADETRRLVAAQSAQLDSLRGDAQKLAWAALPYYLYYDHPYGHPPLGRDTTLRTLTGQDIRSFWEQHYTSDGLTLGLAGKIPSGAARSLQDALAKVLPHATAAPVTPPDVALSGLHVYAIDKPDDSVATIAIGSPLHSLRGDSGFAALSLLAVDWSTTGATRNGLDQLLHVDRGLTDFVSASAEPRDDEDGGVLDPSLPRHGQWLAIRTQVKPVNVTYLIRIVLVELARVADHGLAQEDLDGARRYAGPRARLESLNAVDQMRRRLTDVWLDRDGYDERLPDRLAGATAAEVRRSLRSELDPRNLVIVVVTPDARSFAMRLMEGTMTYQYSPDVDARGLARDDQQYFAYRPFWELQKTRVVTSSEMFR